MPPKTVEERVERLESAVFVVERDADHALARTEAHGQQIAHLGDAIDTLSGDLRALTHEVHAEILPRLDAIEDTQQKILGRLDGVEARIGGVEARIGGVEAGVAALLAHFNISPPEAS